MPAVVQTRVVADGLEKTAEVARVNLQRVVDFVIPHETYTVDGPSPAAALNERR